MPWIDRTIDEQDLGASVRLVTSIERVGIVDARCGIGTSLTEYITALIECQSINQSINQSTNQSTNQPTNQRLCIASLVEHCNQVLIIPAHVERHLQRNKVSERLAIRVGGLEVTKLGACLVRPLTVSITPCQLCRSSLSCSMLIHTEFQHRLETRQCSSALGSFPSTRCRGIFAVINSERTYMAVGQYTLRIVALSCSPLYIRRLA
jgi:hypothetical protein